MTNPIKKIAIIGRDADAWITAIFLKSGLGKLHSDLEIEVIELPTKLAKNDFYTVAPSNRALHKIIGINDNQINKMSYGHYFFAQKYSGWHQTNKEFIHAYDKSGINFNGVDFYHYWLKASKSGLQLAFEDFSLGAVIAQHGTFEANKHKANYGAHLMAVPYLSAIASIAKERGVKHTKAELKAVNVHNDKIVTVELLDNTVITADLFIDASGSEAVLMSELQQQGFESWSALFHCDRVITASAPPLTPMPLCSQIKALSCGWYGVFPLANNTGIKVYYSSKHKTKNAVVTEVSSNLGINISNVVEHEHRCGITMKPWIANCIAIGETITTLESLDALDLQALFASLQLLRQLFPNNDDYKLEAKTYNRKIRANIEHLRDFQLSHYLLNTLHGQSFWDECRQIAPSLNLQEKVSLFKRFGYVSIREDDTFQENSWACIFNGHGVKPDSHHPLVDNMPDEHLKNQLLAILQNIEKEVV